MKTPANSPHCGDWSIFSGDRFSIGVDVGFKSDHSAIVLAGEFSDMGATVIAFQRLTIYPLQTPHSQIIKDAGALFTDVNQHGKPCVVAVDSRNNIPFCTDLAGSGIPPKNIVAANLTSSERHAERPQILRLDSVAAREYLLSRSQMFRDLSTAFAQGGVKLCAEGGTQLMSELGGLLEKRSGTGGLKVVTPSGGHDDLAVAAGYAYWALKHLHQPRRQHSLHVRSATVSSGGWT